MNREREIENYCLCIRVAKREKRIISSEIASGYSRVQLSYEEFLGFFFSYTFSTLVSHMFAFLRLFILQVRKKISHLHFSLASRFLSLSSISLVCALLHSEKSLTAI
jgi:hypothetical protein